MSSFRLFRVAICGLDNMKNFSVIHTLQRLVVLEYALAFIYLFIYLLFIYLFIDSYNVQGREQ